MFKKTLKRRTMKVFLMMVLVLVVGLVVFPAGIQAQQYPNTWQAQTEARARAWQRTQEDWQRARAETQQRMREASQRNQEAWQRTQAEARRQFDRTFQGGQAVWQRAEENRAKNYSTIDRVYRPGEQHWSEKRTGEPGEGRAAFGRRMLELGLAHDQLRQEAAQRQRQAAAQREAAAVQAAKRDRWQPTSDWRAPRVDPRMYREVDPGRGQLRYDPSRIGNSYYRGPVYAGPLRSTGDGGRRTPSQGSSRSRDAGAARATPARETNWFDRVFERGSRRPEGSSRSRDAGAARDRTRDTPARETKGWFDRVFEKGSRRP